MSMPNIPDIEPKINLCKEDVLNVLYMSVALQEISLSHILNAQGELLQQVISKNEYKYSPQDLLNINKSIDVTIEKIHCLEKLLVEKLNSIKDI